MRPELKVLHFAQRRPSNMDVSENRLLAQTNLKSAQTTINLLIKELAKVGLVENNDILRLINQTKQNLYVVNDYLK